VKPAIIFMSGLVAGGAGVFVRSCAPHIPDGLLTSWCGGTPPQSLLSASHVHCGGCALIAAGCCVMGLAALLAVSARRHSAAQVAR
jgi:hypothetical protein